MRIQFCCNGNFNGSPNVIAEFNVAEIPTEEECRAIKDEIFDAMDSWEKDNDDFSELDMYDVCYNACKKHLKLIESPVVKTFYI